MRYIHYILEHFGFWCSRTDCDMPPKAAVTKTKSPEVKKNLKVKPVKPSPKLDVLAQAVAKAQAKQNMRVDRNKALQEHVKVLAEKVLAEKKKKAAANQGILKNPNTHPVTPPTKRVTFKSPQATTTVVKADPVKTQPPAKKLKEVKEPEVKNVESKSTGRDKKLAAAVKAAELRAQMDAANLGEYLLALKDADGHVGDLSAGLLAQIHNDQGVADEPSGEEGGEDMEEEEEEVDPEIEEPDEAEAEEEEDNEEPAEEIEDEEQEEEGENEEEEDGEEAGEEDEGNEEQEEETFTMLPYGEIPDNMEGWFEQEGVASVQYEVGRAQTHASFPFFVKKAREELQDKKWAFGKKNPKADLGAWLVFLKFHAKEAQKEAEKAAVATHKAESLAKAAEDTRKKTGLLYTSSPAASGESFPVEIWVWVRVLLCS